MQLHYRDCNELSQGQGLPLRPAGQGLPQRARLQHPSQEEKDLAWPPVHLRGCWRPPLLGPWPSCCNPPQQGKVEELGRILAVSSQEDSMVNSAHAWHPGWQGQGLMGAHQTALQAEAVDQKPCPAQALLSSSSSSLDCRRCMSSQLRVLRPSSPEALLTGLNHQHCLKQEGRMPHSSKHTPEPPRRTVVRYFGQQQLLILPTLISWHSSLAVLSAASQDQSLSADRTKEKPLWQLHCWACVSMPRV